MSPFHATQLDRIVGVIDLKSGQAVHAVAGRRSQYQPVQFAGDQAVEGDPVRLARCYAALGVRRIYVADLDALVEKSPPSTAVSSLLQRVAEDFTEILLDAGWAIQSASESWDRLLENFPRLQVIAATECGHSMRDLESLTTRIPAERVWLGLDFQNGTFHAAAGSPSDWLACCRESGIGSVLPLDTAVVGTQDANLAVALCHRLSLETSELSLRMISGGGVRDGQDVEAFLSAGCSDVLVASALLG